MRRIICAGLILTVSCPPLSAWWSAGGSTHKAISESAVGYIESNLSGQYPDIERFADTIMGATYGLDNDKLAHGYEENVSSREDAGKYNGGDYEDWWKRGVQANYKHFHFGGDKEAYFYVGSMAHLVQDQLVPAHAANVYHVLDDLESYVGVWGLGPTETGDNYWDKNPQYYYYDADNQPFSPIIATQESIKTWNYPATGPVTEWSGRRYWLANSNYPYVGDAFFGDLSKTGQLIGKWGIYGGPGGEDMYARTSLSNAYGTDSPLIATTQLNEAVSYTAGMLMAVSRSLPPLVDSPSLNGSANSVVAIRYDTPNTIAFKIRENRTPTVHLSLRVDSPDGPWVVSESSISVGLEEATDVTQLPFEKNYTVTWNGKYASGKDIPSGTHTLRAEGADEDGNPFSLFISSFSASAGPHLGVDVMGSEDLDFSGIDVTAPTFLNPKGLLASGWDNISVWAQADLSPMTRLVITGPFGNAEYTYPGDLDRKTYPIEQTEDGLYSLTATDQAGGQRSASFQLAHLNLDLDLSATGSRAADKTSAFLKFHFETNGFNTLDRAEWYDSSGTVLANVAQGGSSGDTSYSFGGIPPAINSAVAVYDKAGNMRRMPFTLEQAKKEEYFLVGPTSSDVFSYGFLPGVEMDSNHEGEWASSVAVDTQSIRSGTLVATQYLGSVTHSIITGDQPDLSDGVRNVLETEHITLNVWNSTETPPAHCARGYAGIVCHDASDHTPASFQLKRYFRAEETAFPAELTGVFSPLCLAYKPDNQNYCEQSYQPKLALPVGENVILQGVTYSPGGGEAGRLGAEQVPAGSNVTVKYSDWLSVTFDNVTSPGALIIVTANQPPMPGYLPLREIDMWPAPGLVYTGRARVDLNYTGAGLTNAQLAMLKVYKVNDYNTRDITAYATTASGGTASFYTQDLGTFICV